MPIIFMQFIYEETIENDLIIPNRIPEWISRV